MVGAKDGARLPAEDVSRSRDRQVEDLDTGENPASASTPPEETALTSPPVDQEVKSDERIEASTVDRADQESQVEITATAEAASEEAEELVLDISSSRPWSEDIIVLFATVDGTAKAGSDFENRNGIMKLPAGATSIQLVIPLIDDDEAEDDELLTLFLSSAIEVATISERKIVATIRDDD